MVASALKLGSSVDIELGSLGRYSIRLTPCAKLLSWIHSPPIPAQCRRPRGQYRPDRIIPARFLSRVSRSGYGELLFNDVRGPEFILDKPEASGTSILVVGTNFGCGSSRSMQSGLSSRVDTAPLSPRKRTPRRATAIFFAKTQPIAVAPCRVQWGRPRRPYWRGYRGDLKNRPANQTITVNGQTIGFEIMKPPSRR